jgi:acetyl-CoA carboxylase biotin carboxyl carrier protein
MNLKELKELIDLITEKGFTELEIERQGFRLRMSKAGSQPVQIATPPVLAMPVAATAPLPAVQPAQLAPPAEAASPAVPAVEAPIEKAGSDLHTIKSIMVGTFYRAPSPNSEPFIKVGDRVEPDTVVCIIEAMKLMNPIQAELTGEIAEIYAENGQAVEYGQALFGVRV